MDTPDNRAPISSQQPRRCPTICMLGHDLSNLENRLKTMATVVMAQGVNLLHLDGGLVNSRHGFEAQANIMYDLIDKTRVDGLIIEGVLFHYTGVEEMQRLCERYAPLPMVTQEVLIPGIPGTYIDFYHGMSDILAHLIEIHHYRRIAFIRGPEESIAAEERYRAYTDALRRHDIPFDARLIAPGTFFAPSGAEAVRLLFDERQLQPGTDIRAIVAVNDFTAYDAVEALQKRGIRVPEEVAVTGFDDTEVCRLTTPALTTVRMSFRDMIVHPLVRLLLDQLAGQRVPEEVILPANVVLRESCGCLDQSVVRAANPDTDMRSVQPFSVAFAAQKASMLAALKQAGKEFGQTLPATWAEQLLDAVAQYLLESSTEDHASLRNSFWITLDELLAQTVRCEQEIVVWHDLFSELRRCLLPCLSEPQVLARAENLWQQIRVKIGKMMERVQRCQRFQEHQHTQKLREIEQRLLITFHIEELMDVLAEELPRIGTSECYVALYEDPPPYRYPQPAPEWSRLILAYNETGRIPLPSGGERFRSSQILPAPLLDRDTPYALGVWPLYFREAQLGFIVFAIGAAHNRHVYNALRKQISNALQGALLVQQIEEHAAELSRKQYILDTFMENIPDRIYFKDREGRITRANIAHAQRLGLKTPDEEIGKTDFDFFPQEEARRKYEQEQTILATGRPLVNIEEALPDPDGQMTWSLATKMPLRDEHGEIIGTFGISRDITALKHAEQELRQYRDHLEEIVQDRTMELTRSNELLHAEIIERTRAEEALRVSERQYRLLAENVKDGIVIIQNHAIVFTNTIFAVMLGLSPAQAVTSDPLSVFHETSVAQIQAWIEAHSPITSGAQWQAELRGRNDRQIWAEIEPSAMVWNGQPALLLTIRDITSRKRQEQRLEEERTRLEQENITLKSSIKERYRFGELVGKSPAMQRVYELIISAATSDVNTLICGESGTGKELIARTVHQVSFRKNQAFVPVNCASIPETLFEREFFGHRKGAFTGADRDKPGFFDRAHRGVLFLDEVTELSPATQAKLLRVLQDGEYTPLGSNTPKQADVLLVAATNKDVQQEIRQGRLRKDFFYRICVIEIVVPPLRDRRDDLPLLIEHLLEQYRQKQAQVHGGIPHNLPGDQSAFPGDFVQGLYAYHWPGNVRELENILQRYLATQDLHAVLPSLGMSARNIPFTPSSSESHAQKLIFSEAVTALEKRLITEALEETHYRIGKTAQRLGMPLRTLQYKIKKYQIRLPD